MGIFNWLQKRRQKKAEKLQAEIAQRRRDMILDVSLGLKNLLNNNYRTIETRLSFLPKELSEVKANVPRELMDVNGKIDGIIRYLEMLESELPGKGFNELKDKLAEIKKETPAALVVIDSMTEEKFAKIKFNKRRLREVDEYKALDRHIEYACKTIKEVYRGVDRIAEELRTAL